MRVYAPWKTIPDFLTYSALRYPAKEALLFEGKSYTYSAVKAKVDSIARFLVSRTKRGDVIGVLLPNCEMFIFSYFGIVQAGCIALLLPANISDTALFFQVKKTSPTWIISDSVLKEKVKRNGLSHMYLSVDTLLMQGNNPLPGKFQRPLKPSDTSTILFTSGTQAEPKGVELHHSNVVQATKNIIAFLHWKNTDVDVNISSLSHSFGLGHMHCVFAVGATTVLFRDAVNLKKILQTILDKQATTFGAVPTILRLLLEESFRGTLRKCGKNLRFIQTNTSPLEERLILDILKLLPTTDFNYYYGLSEASRSTFINFRKHTDKLGSVGSASPNVTVRIVDEKGRRCPPFHLGEICIKGKHVIRRYWRNTVASQRIKNGWLHTGDVGYMDADGFLYFKGRKDDVINVAGEKVSPEEIEAVAQKSPGVLHAGAVGVPDRLLGEVVKLFVVIDKTQFDNRALQSLLQKHLERYKIPRFISIIDTMPQTENGKIRRKQLRSLA